MQQPRKPRMILFDYGHTLIAEPEWDSLRGNAALLRRAVKNPKGVTPEDVSRCADELFATACLPVRNMDREMHQFQFDQLLYGLLQVEFALTPREQERVFFTEGVTYAPMPHVRELLALLRELRIRTGVVSNIMSSRGELERRLTTYLPEHSFEFIIASSEYGLRKPDPLLFQLACAKADLPPGDIWFCGDTPRCDVEGAYAAGMFPVWYEDQTVECIWRDPSHAAPACPHLHIHDWRELITILKECS